jgi:phosphoribosyl 1,2-cyclic phosphodiesterase
MRVKFWGVRGSIPSPINNDQIKSKIVNALLAAGRSGVDLSMPEIVEKFVENLPFSSRGTYGSNTACLEVRTDNDYPVLLDCGSGFRPLGLELMKGPFGRGLGEAHILVSHFHWDHLQGWPFFVPHFIKGNKFHVRAGLPDIRDALEKQQNPPFFPVPLNFMSSTIDYGVITEDEKIILPDAEISTIKLYHPGDCYAYRIESNGKSVVYATDSEFSSDGTHFVEKCVNFMSGADVLVMDAQYTFSESQQKLDWGHSSASTAIDIATEAGVGTLVLFHHEPTYDDAKIDQIAEESRDYLEMIGAEDDLNIVVAQEGLELTL